MTPLDCIRESNHIENIFRDPTDAEFNEHLRFVRLSKVTVADLLTFVGVYQPDAVLRNRVGLDVRVGNHLPPRGGPHIQERLESIISRANAHPNEAYKIHVEYETVHPFTDGNGRSGRALWYWCMEASQQKRLAHLGFLHAFYYQTLDATRPT